MLGKAKLHILDFKTTWSEFQKPCQTAAMQGEAELCIYNLKKRHLPRVGTKQLCASAQLGCTRLAGTIYFSLKTRFLLNCKDLWASSLPRSMHRIFISMIKQEHTGIARS